MGVRARLIATFLAGIALIPALSCSNHLGHDIDCLDTFGDSDECRHDLAVVTSGLQSYLGRGLMVRVESTASGRDESRSVVIDGDRVTVTFADFLHEGGGPYAGRIVVDLDGDGRCDDPPTDAVWHEEPNDDDDEDWFVTTTSPQSPCD